MFVFFLNRHWSVGIGNIFEYKSKSLGHCWGVLIFTESLVIISGSFVQLESQLYHRVTDPHRPHLLPLPSGSATKGSFLWLCGCLYWVYGVCKFSVNAVGPDREATRLSREAPFETGQTWSWIPALWPWAGYSNLLEPQFFFICKMKALRATFTASGLCVFDAESFKHSTGNGLFLKVSIVCWIWVTSWSTQME